MFGVVVSGRPVQTAPAALTPTQFAFTLPASPPFSHLVVFQLPGTVLPPDTAAAVYVQIPPSPEFRLLGAVANEKQSAVFKVGAGAVGAGAGAGVSAGAAGDEDAMVDDAAAAAANIVVGVSIEPAAQVAALLATLKSSASTAQPTAGTALVKAGPAAAGSPVPTKVLARRIIANAFNFLASFAGTTGPGGVEVVPLKSFQDWWVKFERRVERDPGFLEREDAAV